MSKEDFNDKVVLVLVLVLVTGAGSGIGKEAASSETGAIHPRTVYRLTCPGWIPSRSSAREYECAPQPAATRAQY